MTDCACDLRCDPTNPGQCSCGCHDWQQVVALYVDEKGPYANDRRFEIYGITRDARTYRGDRPCVCHPLCQRYGRMAKGSPGHQRYEVGDDGTGSQGLELAHPRPPEGSPLRNGRFCHRLDARSGRPSPGGAGMTETVSIEKLASALLGQGDQPEDLLERYDWQLSGPQSPLFKIVDMCCVCGTFQRISDMVPYDEGGWCGYACRDEAEASQ